MCYQKNVIIGHGYTYSRGIYLLMATKTTETTQEEMSIRYLQRDVSMGNVAVSD